MSTEKGKIRSAEIFGYIEGKTGCVVTGESQPGSAVSKGSCHGTARLTDEGER